ncbi:hypothetical protein OESDEN_06958 [Oesophagostomum dentatum]|uniref:Uncharacterized protein n=1 Tax=Oesophagostomum dentatum TaxID=61180 RepID=A0A0B1T6I8_OESDE|nr:hypothetical protein OESDEN_06958 [Oesophagostomum dentatum]
MRARCERTFASLGTFFKRIKEVDETAASDARNAEDAEADRYVRRPGDSLGIFIYTVPYLFF